MQHKPSGLLSDAESASHFIRANSVFAVHEHPQSDKPFVERDWRILKNRPNFDGELFLARLTLPSLLRGKIVVLAMPALWAGRAIGPAHLGDRVNADLLILEVPDSISECLWLIHLSRPLPKNLAETRWLVKYIIARIALNPLFCATYEEF